MAVAQSEKMFREQAFQDPGNARQQSAPTNPDDESRWHEFHDKFLSYGGPPIPLLRKEILGEEGNLL